MNQSNINQEMLISIANMKKSLTDFINTTEEKIESLPPATLTKDLMLAVLAGASYLQLINSITTRVLATELNLSNNEKEKQTTEDKSEQ